jgi:hypothetical protein
MEVESIIDFFSEYSRFRDSNPLPLPEKVKNKYIRSFMNTTETATTSDFRKWLRENYSKTIVVSEDEVPYPPPFSRKRCDVCFSGSDAQTSNYIWEWGVEFKRIQFWGNNGKGNDYGTAKLISPYDRDRSMIHDAKRLALNFKKSKRKVLILYGFESDQNLISSALKRENEKEIKNKINVSFIKNLQKLLNAEDKKELKLAPLCQIFEATMKILHPNITIIPSGNLQIGEFTGHPTGGNLAVKAYEICLTGDHA